MPAEWDASSYREVSAVQKMLAETSLAALTLQGDEVVLDLGCGDGYVTREIAERLPHGRVLGVDPSRNMVELGSRSYAEQANLSFAVADARELAFQAEFDLLVSFNALHWISEAEQPQALKGMRRALKPGGKTLTLFVCDGPRRSLEEVIQDTAATPAWKAEFATVPAPFFHPTPERYRELAEAAGFRVDKLERSQRRWDFGTAEGFETWSQTTMVEWTRHLPEERRLPFIRAVLAAYAALGDAGPHEFVFYQLETRLGN